MTAPSHLRTPVSPLRTLAVTVLAAAISLLLSLTPAVAGVNTTAVSPATFN
jgi:hypothetical protein